MRFDQDLNDFESVVEYYKNRALQLLRFDYILKVVGQIKLDGKFVGVQAMFKRMGNTEPYYSFYLYKDFRGKGNFNKLMEGKKILTSDDCNLEGFLRKNAYTFACVELRDPCYDMISDFYGDDKSKRSQVYLMNHIDEGLAILHWIGASQNAMDAYCLHPIFQGDNAVNSLSESTLEKLSPKQVLTVMEYRKTANAYLSKRKISTLEEIELSPLKDVNDMLIADKIQNFKDFELYHLATHERSGELSLYFESWLERLEIPLSKYQEYKKWLTINPVVTDFEIFTKLTEWLEAMKALPEGHKYKLDDMTGSQSRLARFMFSNENLFNQVGNIMPVFQSIYKFLKDDFPKNVSGK